MVSVEGQFELRYVPFTELVEAATLKTIVRFIKKDSDFYKLARPVQERFIGSINGGGLPNPILEHRSEPKEPRLWLVGYGEWTGFASATLTGVMRSARDTARQIAEALA